MSLIAGKSLEISILNISRNINTASGNALGIVISWYIGQSAAKTPYGVRFNDQICRINYPKWDTMSKLYTCDFCNKKKQQFELYQRKTRKIVFNKKICTFCYSDSVKRKEYNKQYHAF